MPETARFVEAVPDQPPVIQQFKDGAYQYQRGPSPNQVTLVFAQEERPITNSIVGPRFYFWQTIYGQFDPEKYDNKPRLIGHFFQEIAGSSPIPYLLFEVSDYPWYSDPENKVKQGSRPVRRFREAEA